MRLEIVTLAEAIDEGDLSTFELNYGITLPSNYRKFILKKNGGLVEKDKTIHKLV